MKWPFIPERPELIPIFRQIHNPAPRSVFLIRCFVHYSGAVFSAATVQIIIILIPPGNAVVCRNQLLKCFRVGTVAAKYIAFIKVIFGSCGNTNQFFPDYSPSFCVYPIPPLPITFYHFPILHCKRKFPPPKRLPPTAWSFITITVIKNAVC